MNKKNKRGKLLSVQRGGAPAASVSEFVQPDQSEETAKPTFKCKITLEEFLWETSKKEREALKAELCNAIHYYISLDTAVYLENFGVLLPVTLSKNVPRVFENDINVRKETFRTVSFEKCDDLITYQNSEIKKIADTKELALVIHPRLPLFINLNWTEQDTKRYIKGLLLLLKKETIVSGHSSLLLPIGIFYSHHNRQGHNLRDWFAGADIIFKSTLKQIIRVSPSRIFRRPVMENAWEPLEAAFGKTCKTFDIELEHELQQLGYDTSQLGDFISSEQKLIRVSVFEKDSPEDPKNKILIYCTDGLRGKALSHPRNSKQRGDQAGIEFIFQLSTAHQNNSICFDGHIPLWPARPLTIAWILLQGSKTGRVAPGVGLSCDIPLVNSCSTALDTILLTVFSQFKRSFLCKEGPYSYINVVGITAEEAMVARNHSFEYLAALLEHKGLDQVTKVARSSIVSKTKLEPARIKWWIPSSNNGHLIDKVSINDPHHTYQ